MRGSETESQAMPKGTRDDEGAIQGQVGELEMENHRGTQSWMKAIALIMLIREASRRVTARNGSGEYAVLSNIQIIGQRLVKTWIVPIVIVIVCLIPVLVENQNAAPNENFLLHICFGASLVTIYLSVILFILSIIEWNNPKKDLIIKIIVVAAFGFSIVDVSSLMIFWVNEFFG